MGRQRGERRGTAYDRLHQEPCLLVEDLDRIRESEPELWEEFAVSVEQCLPNADKDMPFVINMSHVVDYKGRAIRVCGLVIVRAHRHMGENVMFASIALSTELYDELVKTYGLPYTVRRKAMLHLADGDLCDDAKDLEQQRAAERAAELDDDACDDD